MRIIQLKTENVKKVKAIEITPKTDVVIISGNNGAGKTSVLDSIWYALQGRTGLKGTPMPIRKGEKKASVVLTLEEFIVTRTWTADNRSYLNVTNAEGLTYNSPQELLDSFIGELTFDPLEFAQMKDKDQRQLLLKLAKVDIDSLDVKINELKEARRLQGHAVHLFEGEREEGDFSGIPNREIDVGQLRDEYDKAVENNYDIERAESLVRNISTDIASMKEEIKEKEKSLLVAQQTLQGKKEIPTDELRQKIDKAEEINKLVYAKQRNWEADEKRNKAQTVYDDFTTKIGAVTAEKVKALEKADMPIEGLSVNDTGVVYNDIPFSQLSSSEQLKVSLCIAMALNPKLRVIRITNGSLLDDVSMNTIKKYAKKEKYQIWVEKVDGSGTVGFYIEEGEVVSGK